MIAELDSSLFETQVEQARATVMRLEAEAPRAIGSSTTPATS